MTYTVLKPDLSRVGLLANTGSSPNQFWDDKITQGIAEQSDSLSSSDLASDISNKNLDLSGNTKQWIHTLDSLNVSTLDPVGAELDVGYHVAYYDESSNRNYLMTLTKVTEDATGHAKNAIGVNTAVYDMNGIRLDAKTFDETNGTLKNILMYIFANVPWNIRLQSSNTDVFAFEIKQDDTVQSVLQSVVTLFGVEVDAFMEPVTGATTGALIFGNANAIKRVIVVADELGSDKQIPVVYGHNMTSLSKTTVSDVFGTRFKVIGADDLTVESVNNGSPYLVDDVANQRHNPIGWANGTYRDLIITNNAIKDAKALMTWGKDQVEQLNHPRANYEVSALFSDGIALGDSIIVQDLYAGTPIIVKSRAIKIQSSQANPYNLTVTIGEFVDISRRTNVMTSVLAIANSAKTIAIEAQSAADTAQATADTASSSAQIAQSMANNVSSSVATAVDSAVSQAESMDSELNKSINNSISKTMTNVNNSLATIDSEAAAFKSEADSATSSVASSVSALMTRTASSLSTQASSAISSANKALSSAAGAASSAATALSQAGVNSLATSSVSSDVNGLKKSYTNLNSSAGVLTSQTASLAVSASSAAAQFDKVTSTAGSLASETATLKASASSASAEFTKVNSSAGSLASQAASLAISASSAAIGISNVTSSAGSLASKTASLAVSASSFATTITSMSSENGTQSTAINQLKQTAESTTSTIGEINNKLNDMGQINQLTNTEFSPDFAGWYEVDDGYELSPGIPTYDGSNVVHIKTTNIDYDYLKQLIAVAQGQIVSFSTMMKFAPTSPDDSTVYWRYQLQWLDASKKSLGFAYGTINYQTLDWTLQKSENVIAPDGAAYLSVNYYMRGAGEAWLAKPMLVFSSTVGKYAQGNYNNNGRVSVIEQDLDGITETVSKHTTDINAVTTRVQTAEGSITTATNNITGLQSSQTQTANQLQTEITNRTTGDSNTLTQAKSFTTSQISTYDTGIQSQFTQTSDSFIATLSAINQVIDSSLTNGLDMWNRVDPTNKPSPTTYWYLSTAVSYQGVPSIGINQTSTPGVYSHISSQMTTKNGYQASTLNVSVDVSARTIGTDTTDYFIVYLSEWDNTNTRLAVTSITGTITTSNGYWVNYRKKITLNTNTTKVMLTYQMRGNGNVYVSRPYVGVSELPAGAYVEGPVSNSSGVLALMADKYTFGLNSNGQLVSGIMGDEKQVTLAGKAINLDGNTTVSGDFYALGGNFKNLNASEIKTGTINASLINVINLNASNITTGAINGANLTINLDTGQVVFQKGRLYRSATAYSTVTSKNETIYPIDVNLDSGYISVESANSKILLKDGGISLTQPNFLTATTNPYLDISNKTVTGFATNPSASLIASDMVLLSTKNGANEVWTLPFLNTTETFTGFYSGQVDTSTNLTKVGGGTNGVVIAGGSAMTSDGNHSPAIIVGSNGTGTAVGSNRVYVSAQYFHLPASYTNTGSTSANLYVAADGAVLRSSSSSRFKLNIEYETDASTAEQLLTLNPATWDDKFETEQINRLHETGEETDIAINKRRYYGIIAEDLVKANLDYLVQRNEQTNEVDGVEYAKIGVALIPIIRELRDRVNEQALEIERLKEMTK